MRGVNLSGVQLSGAKSGVWKYYWNAFEFTQRLGLLNGYLIGPGADLAEADITDFDLASLKIDGISSGGVIGEPLAYLKWSIVNGYLVGPTEI